MSRRQLKSHAEVIKLGRLIGEPPERLAYLEKLQLDDLRILRELATDAQYEADAERFKRIAFASTLAPVSLTALIARRAFGALLCARIAGVLGTDHAIAIADRMPAEFLADLAVELDPRRAADIIAGMPPDQIASVAELLNMHGEHVAMGRFVGHMTDPAIEASLEVIDDASLLRISYVLEGDDGLKRVIELMSRERLRSAIRAATEHDLWPEALDLLGRVPHSLAGQLGDLAAEEDDSVLAGMVATAQTDDLWDAVLPVMGAMSDTGRRRFAALPSIHQPEVLTAIVRSAMLTGSWRDLLPLVPLLPRESQVLVWSEVIPVAEALPVETTRLMVSEALDLGLDHMLPDILSAADDADLWSSALHLLAALGPELHERLAPTAAALPAEQRSEALAHARDLGLLGELGVLGDALDDRGSGR